MKSSKNVILIGMPGSGKSTVGVVLAKVLGYRFIDSDLEIQSQEGKRLPELIEEFGTEGFLDIEARVNASMRDRNRRKCCIQRFCDAAFKRDRNGRLSETDLRGAGGATR